MEPGFEKRTLAVAFAVLVPCTFLLSGCAGKVREYRCAPNANEPSVDVLAIWNCNRRIIEKAIQARGFSLREYRNAVAFFERITGTPADNRDSELGILPGSNLARTLETWDAWLRENRHRLLWDADNGVVVKAVLE